MDVIPNGLLTCVGHRTGAGNAQRIVHKAQGGERFAKLMEVRSAIR
jgi:hypothetical protein